MKKLMFLVAIFSLLSMVKSYAQLHNYNAYELSYKVKVNGVWNEWSEWEDCSIPINIKDFRTIKIYSRNTQEYTITETIEKTDNSATFRCKQLGGGFCSITLNRDGDVMQVLVSFPTKMWIYNSKNN